MFDVLTFHAATAPAWALWLSALGLFVAGYLFGLSGYARARADAYRDFVAASQRMRESRESLGLHAHPSGCSRCGADRCPHLPEFAA